MPFLTIYNFIKDLLFSEPTNNEDINSFVVINPPITKSLQTLNQYVNPDLLVSISKQQVLAKKYDHYKEEKIECCICYNDDVNFMPLICSHPICGNCYVDLTNHSFTQCPMCKKDFIIAGLKKVCVC